MIVELIENRISIPLELLEELEVENGQQLHLSVTEGILHVCPAEALPEEPSGTDLTPDQEMAHFIADSFTNLEDMVAMMAAVCDVKGRIRNGDPERIRQVGQQLEEIVMRARRDAQEDEASSWS